MIKFFLATDAQLIDGYAWQIRDGHKVQFRHHGYETIHGTSKTGCQLRKYGRAKLQVIEGVPYVQHHGKLRRVTASVFYGRETGRPVTVDLRLATVDGNLEDWTPSADVA